MAFVFTTVAGTAVTVTAYSINPAAIYIVSKQDHNLGNSPFNIDYPYYVDRWNKPTGEQITTKSYTVGDYMVVLYGSEDAVTPFNILDFSVFTLGTPAPVISNVTATLISAGNIKVSWYQDKPGFITVTRNGISVFTWNESTAGSKDWDSMNNVSGTITFCVNGVCAPPVVLDCVSTLWSCEIPANGYEFDGCGTRRLNPLCGSQGVSCTALAVDTWKPANTNPKTGANLAITVRSKEFNKAFNIGYADAITLERHVIMSGVTDATGCFTGEIPAQADGVYNLTVCFLFLNISCPITAPIVPISITWGSKPLDIITTILYGALGLGALYIIGQAIVKDRSNKLK